MAAVPATVLPPTVLPPLTTIGWRAEEGTLHAFLPAAGGAIHHLHFAVDPVRPRLRVGLATGVRSRPLDISRQPGVVERLVDEATACATAPGANRQQVAQRLVRHLAERGAWAPYPARTRPDALLVLVGGAAFPLLAAAYDSHALPRREVPTWAAPVLAEHDARAGAERAVGPAAASRPVIAALAGSLATGARPVDLAPLALALMAARTLDPDRLARLLAIPRPPLDACAPPPPEPEEEDIRRGVHACRCWGPEVTAGVLGDALRDPDGIRTLVDLLAHWPVAAGQLHLRLPRRLEALRALVHHQLPGDPDPARHARQLLAEVFDTRPGPPALAEAAPPPRTPASRPLAPPSASGPLARSGFSYPPHLRALDGAGTGSVRLVLPRTPDELATWGEQLGNCLADFGVAVSSGRSHLIGVEVDDRLLYCLELTPRGRIRQFLGVRNRPPTPEHHRITLELLRARNLVRPGIPCGSP